MGHDGATSILTGKGAGSFDPTKTPPTGCRDFKETSIGFVV